MNALCSDECISIYCSYFHIWCAIGLVWNIKPHYVLSLSLVPSEFGISWLVYRFFGWSFTSQFWYMNFNDICYTIQQYYSLYLDTTPRISKTLPKQTCSFYYNCICKNCSRHQFLNEKTMVMSVRYRTCIFSVRLINLHLLLSWMRIENYHKINVLTD
jgi:hypothetical protein